MNVNRFVFEFVMWGGGKGKKGGFLKKLNILGIIASRSEKICMHFSLTMYYPPAKFQKFSISITMCIGVFCFVEAFIMIDYSFILLKIILQ
jgi:hypothetical protein